MQDLAAEREIIDAQIDRINRSAHLNLDQVALVQLRRSVSELDAEIAVGEQSGKPYRIQRGKRVAERLRPRRAIDLRQRFVELVDRGFAGRRRGAGSRRRHGWRWCRTGRGRRPGVLRRNWVAPLALEARFGTGECRKILCTR